MANNWITALTSIAKDSGTPVHHATAKALLSRYLISGEKGAYSITEAGKIYIEIMNKIGDGFVCVHRRGEDLGMLCYVKGKDVVNCWGNPYDLRNVYIEHFLGQN